MTSTLTAPTHSATAPAADPDATPLFDTMRAVVHCRSRHRPVPGHLLDELRERRLATLVDAIERYNARMRRVAASA